MAERRSVAMTTNGLVMMIVVLVFTVGTLSYLFYIAAKDDRAAKKTKSNKM